MFKRAFDLVLSLVLLVLFFPLALAISLAIKIAMPGPVLYGGVRIGRDGRAFRMWKFRSMVVAADQIGGSSTAADDSRVTPLGRFLRRFKLDELPQLINVVRGDMSFVGPRPQVEWAVRQYTQEEMVILKVRPGITDPASLRFANEAEILRGSVRPDELYMKLIHPEKMRLSLEYVRNHTLAGDLAIIARTAAVVLGLASYTLDPDVLKGVDR